MLRRDPLILKYAYYMTCITRSTQWQEWRSDSWSKP